MGTPQNIDDLVFQLMLIPANQFQERAPQVIREYLAQSFGVALLDADEATEKRLFDLFERLMRRK